LNLYGCSKATTVQYNACPAYIRQAAVGETTLATPTLEPEESRSWTFGVVVEPWENISFTLDYYDIEKTGAITAPPFDPAIEAYYLGQPIPTGYTVQPGTPDVNNPTLRPVLNTVAANLVNANTVRSKGYDFTASALFDIASIKFKSVFEISYIDELSTTFPDGTVQQYAGTLGNFNLTAGSGTPALHGVWQNTATWEKLSTTLNINYFGGYNLSAMDQGTEYKDCGLSPGITPCDVSHYTTFDLIGSYNLTEKINVYVNIINVTDELPPIDPVTYGANNYNPVQGGEGIIGREYRLGVRLKF
jgi:iron complex outermembrane receptor protein